jgi:adenylate cyclase class IV
MSQQIEVEVKALVSDISELRSRIEYEYPSAIKAVSKQLNHYFASTKQSLSNLFLNIETSEAWQSLELPADVYTADNINVRTRWDSVQGSLFIIKYSLVDSNSENGNVRREIELPIAIDLETLDQMILNNGLVYQSKWSRDRVEYKIADWSICTDLNAGYGGLCEVETVVSDASETREALRFCLYKLSELGLIELDSNLLKKMFAFYSANFNDFYGTDKLIFNDPRFIA